MKNKKVRLMLWSLQRTNATTLTLVQRPKKRRSMEFWSILPKGKFVRTPPVWKGGSEERVLSNGEVSNTNPYIYHNIMTALAVEDTTTATEAVAKAGAV